MADENMPTCVAFVPVTGFIGEDADRCQYIKKKNSRMCESVQESQVRTKPGPEGKIRSLLLA